MPRGRPRKPVETHKRDGTYRKDRHAIVTDTTIPPSTATCPAWVHGKARQHWAEISVTLEAINLMSETYTLSLGLLVDALADFIRYAKLADDAEPVITTTGGNMIQHPSIGLKNGAWERVLKAAREFGLSPSTIGGVTRTKEPAAQTKAAKFFLRVAK